MVIALSPEIELGLAAEALLETVGASIDIKALMTTLKVTFGLSSLVLATGAAPVRTAMHIQLVLKFVEEVIVEIQICTAQETQQVREWIKLE